jgi:Protein of unknown function (DUF732)
MALMANREQRPSDPTVAASLDGGYTVAAPVDAGQTTAVPNTRPTDKVELAWSTGDVLGGEEIPEDVRPAKKPQPAVVGQSWGTTLRIASLLVAGCLVLAGAIVLGRWVFTSEKSNTATPSQGSTAAAPSASDLPATTSPVNSNAAQDNQYLESLDRAGIKFDNHAQAINNGKVICQNRAAKWSMAKTIQDFRDNFPSLSDRAEEFVNLAISAYCPERAG